MLQHEEIQSMEENRSLPATLVEQMRAQSKAIADKIGSPTGDKIKLQKNKTFKVPGADIAADRLRVVVLDFVGYNAYYDRPFSEKERTPPACFALGAGKPELLVPSANAPKKQSEEGCDKCVMNEWGSKGNGKQCGNHRILAVTEPSGDPKAPIFLIQLPPTSIKFWDEYVRTVSRDFERPPVGVVTDIFFEPTSDYPSPRFGEPTLNPDIEIHFPRLAEAMRRLMVEPDVSKWEPIKAPGRAKK